MLFTCVLCGTWAHNATRASAAISPDNLIANPSFEIDTSGWGSYRGSVARIVSPLDAPDGTAVVQVTADAGNDDGYTLDDAPDTITSASGGRTYTANAYVKAGTTSALGKPLQLVIRQRLSDGSSPTRCGTSDPVLLSATYQVVTVACVAAHSGDRLDVYLERSSDVTPSESFYADAITLIAPHQASIPADNLTANPSFETDDQGWIGFQSTRTVITPADGDAPVGTKIVEVSADSGASSYSIDDAPATVANAAGAYTYRASAWVRATPASDGKTIKIALRERNADNTAYVQQQSTEAPITVDKFTRVTVSLTAQATGNSIDVYVARGGNVDPNESFLADAIALTRTAPASIPANNLTVDPSFSDHSGNWVAFQGHVTQIAGQDDAPDGTTVGKVVADANRTYDSFSVDDDTPAVPHARLGYTYAASAWVKAGAPTPPGGPPKTASLVIRESDQSGTVQQAYSPSVTLRDDRYQRLQVRYLPQTAGNAIDVYVMRSGDVTTGETFYVDAMTMTETPIASVFGSSVTVRPDTGLPAGGATSAQVSAAKNETASFQIALRTTGVPLAGVHAAPVGPLSGPASSTIPTSAVSVYREDSYDVAIPTDGEGSTGQWPDELVPDRDPLLQGDGGAFPFDMTAHDAAALWVDVNVPLNAAAGSYTGTLRLTTTGGTALTDVPIELTVRPFALPSTSSLRSVFLLNPYDVCGPASGAYDGGFSDLGNGWGCDPADERTWAVFARFAELGLRNRISIANPYPTPNMRAPSVSDPVTPYPSRAGAPTTTAAAFDLYVNPLLDGTAAQGTLPGAQLTAMTTQWGCIRDPGSGHDCLADWKSFLDAHNSAAKDRFVAWPCDEPRVAPSSSDPGHQTPWGYLVGGATTGNYAPCEDFRGQARTGWSGVPVMITTAIDDPGLYPNQVVQPSLLDTAAADVLTPSVTDLVSRSSGSSRAGYDPFLTHPGAQLWLYSSCTSGGCDPGETDPEIIAQPAYDGWPSYAIDQPGSQASAMGWMAFLYGASGETYFDVALGFDKGPAFHHGIDTFGTNGDGQLFYPGHVQIDGPSGPTTEDMPFESIRLKRIREGREDYEYLHLLDTCGHRAEAISVVENLYGDPDHAMFQTTVSQAQLDAARQDLADLIEQYGCG